MKVALLFFILFSSSSWACWNMKGELRFNNQVVKIDQKIDHDKVYSFPIKNFIFNLKVPSTLPEGMKKKKGIHLVEIEGFEKQGTTLKKVTNGKIFIKEGSLGEMKKVDDKTKDVTHLKLELNHI